MRFPWLFTSLSCLVILYLSNPLLSILAIIFFFLYHLHHFNHNHIFFVVLLLHTFSIQMLQVAPPIPQNYTVRILELHANYCVGDAGDQKVILYDVTNVNFDDIIQLEGTYQEIDGVHNEGEFYFPTWANHKGIYYAMTVKTWKLMEAGSSIRNHLYQEVSSRDDQVSKWLKMTLFGIREDQEVMYMASSSGVHIQFILSLIRSIGSRFLPTSIITMLSLVILSFLGLSTTFSITFQRILWERILSFMFPKQSSKDRLGFEILLFIFFMPTAIYDIAFVLPIAFRFVTIFNVHKLKRIILSFFILIPIQFYFYQYLDILQILLFPIYRIFYGLCYGIGWLMLWFPLLSFLIPLLLYYQKQLFLFHDTLFKLYYLPNMIWLFLWIFQCFLYLDTKKKKQLFTLVMLLFYTQLAPYLNPFFQVTMIDVGQGDCTLFILPFHQGAMLLDVAGNLYKNIPEDIIYPMLLKRGIHSLDKVILTHEDYDHSGGLTELKEQIDITEVITEKQEEIALGKIRFASPLYDHTYPTSNDSSILLSLQLYDFHMLFMGDCGVACEEDLLKEYPKIKADIVKLGHHGSRYSSSIDFLHQLDPTIALISSGRHNRYGHPDEEVMERLREEEIYPLLTAQEGSCTFYFSKILSFYKTADGEFGIIKHR